MSSEFPTTNKSLGDAFAGATDMLGSIRELGVGMDEPATVGQTIDALTAAFGAMAASLIHGEHAHPQTVCPIPTNPDMAAAMQLLGYEHLRLNAPDRLRRDLVGIPAADLGEVLGWLEGALKCKEWEWSPDQHAFASAAYDRAMIFLNGFEHDGEAKDPRAGIQDNLQDVRD